jgi:hypothetical protein
MNVARGEKAAQISIDRRAWQTESLSREDYALEKCEEKVNKMGGRGGVLRLNCPEASTTVPAMKKSIILVSALSVVMMSLVSCASDSDVDPYRINTEKTPPAYHEAAPAHDNIGGLGW